MSRKFMDRFIDRVEEVDPTSRQACILRLIRERGFFETVFNTVEEGILVIDRFLRIRYHNAAAKSMLGLPDNLGKVRLPQFLREVDWQGIIRGDGASKRTMRQELEIFYPVRRFVQFYLVALEEEERMSAVIIRDVTEARERSLSEVEKQTSQAVGLLAAQVAHEIGNPLNSLYLNLQLLERCAEEENAVSGDEALEMVRSCRSEVERLDNIILQFLSAIRPGDPKFEPVSLPVLVTETLKFMHREIEARAIEVVCDFPPTVPTVRGDPGQLKQAFFNIIKNALQATASPGELKVACAVTADSLQLDFTDSGKGIEPGNLKQIFTPFQSFREGGNGIGMMIIERVAREHGAELGVASTPGEGTTISLRFPLRPRQLRVLPG